jgi:hypothetical protein
MVLREVGERACRQLHAMQAVLRQAVRRRLHRHMLHTLARQPVEHLVDRHRIRRRVPEIDGA